LIQDYGKENHEENYENEKVSQYGPHYIYRLYSFNYSQYAVTGLSQSFILVYLYKSLLYSFPLSVIVLVVSVSDQQVHHHSIIVLACGALLHGVLDHKQEFSHVEVLVQFGVLSCDNLYGIGIDHLDQVLKEKVRIEEDRIAESLGPLTEVVIDCREDCVVPDKLKILPNKQGENVSQ
jgi:hypothetical protein